MRNRLMIGAAALLLASATACVGAGQAAAGRPPRRTGVDIGGRFTSASGDEARYERYRDLRSGANANVLFNKETENWAFNVKATNIGYRDQRYTVDFTSKRVKLSFLFDSTPLNYCYDAKTPYVCTAGNCALDAGLRSEIQAARGTRCATAGELRRYDAVGVPQTPGAGAGRDARTTRSPSRSTCSRAATRSRPNLRFSATDNLDLLLGVKSYSRTGNQPWGIGFAFNNLGRNPAGRSTTGRPRSRPASSGRATRACSGWCTSTRSSTRRPDAHRGQPAARDRLEHVHPGGLATTRAATLDAHGAAMSRMAMAPTNTLNTFELARHGQAARPHHGERQLHHGRQQAERGADPLDDQRLVNDAHVRDVPGAGPPAARVGGHVRELHHQRDERELAADQGRHAERALPLQQPQRLHAAVPRGGVRALGRGARGDGRRVRAVQHQPQHVRPQRGASRRSPTAPSGSATRYDR